MDNRTCEESIYLDYAATCPLYPESADAMAPYIQGGPANICVNANPNSLYEAGRKAYSALEDARGRIAEGIGANRPDEVVFTSCATEADNAALIGLASAAIAAPNRSAAAGMPHIITTSIEHDAVLAPARSLEKSGFEVTYLKPDRSGHIPPESLESAMRKETVLVSIQAANSETGAVNPVRELAQVAHSQGALFHTDAVQALGKIDVNMGLWEADAASFSAHKIGGPRGIGALYLKSRTRIVPGMLGGGQERGLRSGTQNVCGAQGFAAALETSLSLLAEEAPRLEALRDSLYSRLLDIPGIKPTVNTAANPEGYLPNIVNVMVGGIESESLVLRLDSLGFQVSGGSACSSHSLEPSHVLTAMGINPDDAYCALRVSMGRYTTASHIEAFAEAMPKVIDWNRR